MQETRDGARAALVLHDALLTRSKRMRKQTEHRIRGAASLARPGRTWFAAIVMNAAPWAAVAVIGWFTFTSDEPAVTAMAGVLFVMALVWSGFVTLDAWRVLRRFTRRGFGGPPPR